jgi:hypothetical protein
LGFCGGGGGRTDPVEDLTVGADDTCLHLGAADIDGQQGGATNRRECRLECWPNYIPGRQAVSRSRADVAYRGISRRGGSAHGSSHGDRGPDC